MSPSRQLASVSPSTALWPLASINSTPPPRPWDHERIGTLPPDSAPWQMTVRDTPRSCDPAGLFRLILVVSPAAGSIRNLVLTTSNYGHEGQLLQALAEAMFATGNELRPTRPTVVLVDSQPLLAALRQPLAQCGIVLRGQQPLRAVDQVFEQLAERRGLFSDGTLFGTAVYETELARAAAQIARAEPFRRISGELPLVLRFAEGAEPAPVVVLMGQGSEVQGVVAYASAQAYRTAPELTGEQTPNVPWEHRRVAQWALFYQPACELSNEARAAFLRRSLPVAHQCYPRLRRMNGTGKSDIESPAEARAIVRCLEAVRCFVDQHRRWHS